MKENSIEGIIDIIKEKYTRYLNCETDIIGLTIEEAIFILKTDERRNYVTGIVQEACKVILSDYKRVLKENEELKRNYKILKDDIEDERIVYIDTPEFEQRYIPVQKVKDKIEELKNNLHTIEHYETVGAIHVLRELIESEE